MWGIPGADTVPAVDSWDPKTDVLADALLAIVASGATVVLRPGSGGRSIGVAIWEGDFRHPPTWLYDSEEMDNWGQAILRAARTNKEHAAD